MGKLITNQKKLLSEIINNILPFSQQLYFLVGYFYMSGFQEIYKNVVDKKIKILVKRILCHRNFCLGNFWNGNQPCLELDFCL